MRAVRVELGIREQEELVERPEQLRRLWNRRGEITGMGLRDRLRQVQKRAEGEMIVIPQQAAR